MNVVITGKNGYIGNNLCKFLNEKNITAQTVSVRIPYKEDIFNNVDCVVHCAAIVHKKEKQYKDIYSQVNYNLTVELAQLAKKSGVKHFVFISTMSVYGKSTGEINASTPLKPVSLYGKTKLMAEEELEKIQSEDFKITIIRPPMVYGENCTGNYSLLRKLLLPVFPDTDNKRSMIYIDNLSNVIYSVINDGIYGLVLPQNKEYVNTGNMVCNIGRANNKKIILFKAKFLKKAPFNIVKKVFGSLYYNKDIAFVRDVCDFEQSVKKTEEFFC